MEANKSIFISLFLMTAFLFSACTDSKEDEKRRGAKGTDNQSINDWIYEEMSEKYYWNQHIPKSTSLNFNDAPNKFYFDLLYEFKKGAHGDRFSSIEEDGVPYYTGEQADSKASHKDIGFEFQAYSDNKQPSSLVDICVTYIKKDSEAEKQGELKRGDWIHSIDGKRLTVANFLSLIFSAKSELKLQLEGGKIIHVDATPIYYESPIYHWSIIPLDEKKVGYIVYNFFSNGKEEKTMDYALKMNEILKSFEGKVDELILDLRYNGGGYVESGTYIASALAPDRIGKIYTKRNYNAKLEKDPFYRSNKNNYFYETIKDGHKSYPIPQLNLGRLYVITSSNTASASEQIINGLRAHLSSVEVVGRKTVGKNMESFSIPDKKNKENKWILHPLTSVSYRSDVSSPEQNNYSEGFKPTVPTAGEEISEVHFYYNENNQVTQYPMFELGDPKELLLSVALQHIKGESEIRARAFSKISEPSLKTPIVSSLDRKKNSMIVKIEDSK